MQKKIRKLVTFWNLFILLILSLFLRLYRLPELLGFWYDQGRDALVVWDLIHSGKLFLIGPMMGNTGIFRGPWYYYLIAPFYYIGGGNPVYPAIFLVVLSVVSIYILYLVAVELSNRRVGIMSAVIATFSAYLIGASRWLSNPTPTLLTGVLFIYSCFRFLDRKWWALPLASLTVGLGLNFGAATEIYLIPALILIVLLNKNKTLNAKNILFSVFLFVFTFLPQIIFEIRHNGVMSKAFYDFVVNKNTFTINFIEIFVSRIYRYYDLFASKFWTDGNMIFLPFFLIFLIALVVKFRRFWKDKKFQILFIVFISPFVGTLFFVSNLGGFYDYYFTAYYLVFILMFAYVYESLFKNWLAKAVFIVFISLFLFKNIDNYIKSYNMPLSNADFVVLGNQRLAVSWVLSDAKSDEFNLDVYVPPVIPYAYDYLFKWYAYDKDFGNNVTNDNRTLLYTLYELDSDHPERLNAWLDRQKDIGVVEYEETFANIVVQRRARIK